VAQTSLRLHGIDQSLPMIAAAPEKSQAVSWHIGNVEALPLPDGLFSGVMCTLERSVR
jgi:ubiquinone/menaquinone biosynthesis C-methylase UbiE